MLGAFVVSAESVWMPNKWMIWLDHVMKEKHKFGFSKVAILHSNGVIAAASKRNYVIKPTELMAIQKAFEVGDLSDMEPLRITGNTYIVKSCDERQLVAFNGKKYYIITKTNKMFIIALCDKRKKSEAASQWLRHLAEKLVSRHY